MPEISNYFKIYPGKIGDYATFYQLQLDACGFNQRASGLTPCAKKEGPLISASTGSGIRPSTNNPKEVFPASLSCRLRESRPWLTNFWRGLSSGDTGCEVPVSCPEACWLSRGQLLGGLAHLPSRTLLLGVKKWPLTLRAIWKGEIDHVTHLEVLFWLLPNEWGDSFITRSYGCHHWCSWETLSSFDWVFIVEKPGGGRYLVNLPVGEEEALPLTLQKDQVSLIPLQKEICRRLATVPNSFETLKWKFKLLDLFCDDRGSSSEADLAKHRDTSWKT